MGSWSYYVSFLKMGDIAEKFDIEDQLQVCAEDTNTANSISNYLLTNPRHFLNSLVVQVRGGSAKWYELAIRPNELLEEVPIELEGTLGLLYFENSVEFIVMKGKNQVEGIRLALTQNRQLATEEVSVVFIGRLDSIEEIAVAKELVIALNRFS
jgi:DNA sulfur modification protein DndB